MTMKSILVGVCVLSLIASRGACAANPWEAGGSLDTCIEAVLKDRPGIVTGWQQSGGGDAPPYVISILDKEGKNAEAFCDPAKPSSFTFTNKMGLYRYSMYERAVVPEVKARATAPEIFAGPARLTVMDLSVGVSGKPIYKYQMFLPGGHKATVEIDAVTGRLNKGQVN
jgi:hypothetical protein